MNSTLTNPDRRTHRILPTLVFSVGVVGIFAVKLVLTPCLYAQSAARQAAPQVVVQPEPDLYSMKFDGRDVGALEQKLKSEFPKDNVVIAPSARHIRLDAFEVRQVRLKELGKTIEFLSEGLVTVDVVERDKGTIGNIWRIGSKKSAGTEAAAKLKTRSVAAPRLFADPVNVDRLTQDANKMERIRLERMIEFARAGSGDFSGVEETRLVPLPDQKIFVIVGTEDGIAGMESFIKAAEQLAENEATKKMVLASSLAPTMRAVLAPHLFNNEPRLHQITEEFENVQGLWNEAHDRLMKMVGINDDRGGVCVQQRPDQRLFVLIGAERNIAGMESLIQAAEKNAAEEDARELAMMLAERAKLKAIEESKAAEAEKAAEKAKKGE